MAGGDNQPSPSALVVNGWGAAMGGMPKPPGGGWESGGVFSSKSGLSSPTQLRFSESHQTNFLRSDQGRPSGSAEARLYRTRTLFGQAKPHSGWIGLSVTLRSFARLRPGSGKTPL